MSQYHETVIDALEAWDRGDIVWTIEMGGLGPGYEQCIHIACFEILRDLKDHPIPWDDEDRDSHAWKKVQEAANQALNRADRFPGMGMSGAQAGAAKSLAFFALKHGWRGMIEDFKSKHPDDLDRMTMVSKSFPQAP